MELKKMDFGKVIHILFLITGAAFMGAIIATLFSFSGFIGAIIGAVLMTVVQIIEYYGRVEK